MQCTISHRHRALRYAALALGLAVVVATWCAANASENGSEAADAAATPEPTRIVEPVAPQAFDADGDPDVAAVMEIWKKLRGEQADNGPDAEALADVLRQVKEQDESHPTTRSETGDRNSRRYAEGHAIISELSDRPNPTADDDAKLLRLALLGYGWQKRYDAELADRAAALRKAARQIDEIAAELEEADAYKRADQLFDLAGSLRYEARDFRQRQPSADGSYDAAKAATEYSLHTLRSQIQLYRSEHAGRNPEVKPDAEGNSSLPQLITNTNEKGEIGTGSAFPLGPYLIAIPENPMAYDRTNDVVADVREWPPKKTVPRVGWLYHPPTGRILPNARAYLEDRNDEF